MKNKHGFFDSHTLRQIGCVYYRRRRLHSVSESFPRRKFLPPHYVCYFTLSVAFAAMFFTWIKFQNNRANDGSVILRK